MKPTRTPLLLLAALALLDAPTARGGSDVPVVVVGAATGVPGEEVTIPVTFHAASSNVSGVQNDITFDVALSVVTCAANPDIDKGLTGFGLHGNWMRAVVNGLDTEALIPDGAVMYRCTFLIAQTAAPNDYALTISNVIASDPQGMQVPVTGASGQVIVAEPAPGASPIATRTPTPTATAIPTVPADVVVTLTVESAEGVAGTDVTIRTTLDSGGYVVASMQNDITVDPATPIAATADSKPDCTLDPSVNVRSAHFTFLPALCVPGVDCVKVRAEAFLQPTSGRLALYSCKVHIGAEVPPGGYPIVLTNLFAADSQSTTWPVQAGSADVVVVTPPGATPRLTWTAAPSPTPTPTPAPFGELEVNTITGAPGETVTVTVALNTSGVAIAATENDLTFDRFNTRIGPKPDGRPDCTVNPDIGKSATVFSFQPSGCAGVGCTSIRALVFAFDNIDPIPNGSPLYTCKVSISAQAQPDWYPLTINNVSLSDPQGNAVAGAWSDGGIVVGDDGVTANPLPGVSSPRAEPSPTGTPALIVLDAPQHATADGGGCAILASGHTSARTMLERLLPACLLVWRRRREQLRRNRGA